MKRKTSNTPTRIWTYGCGRPTAEDERIIFEHLKLASDYQNRHVDAETTRREAYRDARAKVPGLQETEERYDAIVGEIRALREGLNERRKRDRKRTVHPAVESRIKQLVADRKTLKVERDAMRARFANDPKLRATSERAGKEAYAAIKEAYNAEPSLPDGSAPVVPLYWGTKLLIDKAAEAARKEHTDPQRKRFRGEGRIGVQIQGGMTVAELHSGQDTRLQIAPPDAEWDGRTGRRARQRTIVRLRVGSRDSAGRIRNSGHTPIWVTLPMTLHRPLPDDAVIKWAWILVRKIGPDTEYSLQLAIEAPSFEQEPKKTGAVAVDLGWTVVAGGIRVATAVDAGGNVHQLILPTAIREKLDHASALRGHADEHFNVARAALVAYLRSKNPKVPEWLPEWTENIHAWRAHRKLARIAGRWAREIVAPETLSGLWQRWKASDPDDLLVPRDELDAWLRGASPKLSAEQRMAIYLEWWRRKNRHLYTVERRITVRALRRRRDIYRNWAAWLRQNYGAVFLEKIDLRGLARNAQPEEDAGDDATHRVRFVASPSELRGCIQSALGSSLNMLPVSGRAKRCPVCGQDGAETDDGTMKHRECRSVIEADYARCWNLLDDAGVDTKMVRAAWQRSAEAIRKLQQMAPQAAE